ncbi:uncharacterized protein LTR77_010970 [Saxophila tyrrhenica]|uniref:F-box domain-containing protein n=1 Tax=Saxophila tyrrhenica TaxID=1690608 RepID=A0AAV9NXE4_9PEZI|nr:hypothetical protein LTR77_010970 [Saxophila tyrrhenica]
MRRFAEVQEGDAAHNTIPVKNEDGYPCQLDIRGNTEMRVVEDAFSMRPIVTVVIDRRQKKHGPLAGFCVNCLSSSTRDHLSALPAELLIDICSRLPGGEMHRIRMLSKRFKAFSDTNERAIASPAIALEQDRLTRDHSNLVDITAVSFAELFRRYVSHYGLIEDNETRAVTWWKLCTYYVHEKYVREEHLPSGSALRAATWCFKSASRILSMALHTRQMETRHAREAKIVSAGRRCAVKLAGVATRDFAFIRSAARGQRGELDRNWIDLQGCFVAECMERGDKAGLAGLEREKSAYRALAENIRASCWLEMRAIAESAIPHQPRFCHDLSLTSAAVRDIYAALISLPSAYERLFIDRPPRAHSGVMGRCRFEGLLAWLGVPSIPYGNHFTYRFTTRSANALVSRLYMETVKDFTPFQKAAILEVMFLS